MNSKRSVGITELQRDLLAYIKSTGSRAAVRNVSTYSLASLALVKEGMVKPNFMSDKCFVLTHIDHIRKISKKQNKNNSAAKKKDKNNFFYIDPIYASSVDFLKSYEWRKVRMEAIKKYGSKCQCCGSSPATGAVINVDHIKPRKTYPQLALDINNLQVLCHECNHGKGNWDQTDWRGT